jgi:hypothetical protein
MIRQKVSIVSLTSKINKFSHDYLPSMGYLFVVKNKKNTFCPVGGYP